jgi:hypothetical protein
LAEVTVVCGAAQDAFAEVPPLEQAVSAERAVSRARAARRCDDMDCSLRARVLGYVLLGRT